MNAIYMIIDVLWCYNNAQIVLAVLFSSKYLWPGICFPFLFCVGVNIQIFFVPRTISTSGGKNVQILFNSCIFLFTMQLHGLGFVLAFKYLAIEAADTGLFQMKNSGEPWIEPMDVIVSSGKNVQWGAFSKNRVCISSRQNGF